MPNNSTYRVRASFPGVVFRFTSPKIVRVTTFDIGDLNFEAMALNSSNDRNFVVPGGGTIIPISSGPSLHTAVTFGILGGSAGATNQATNTIIHGDLGTTGAPTLITGFHDGNNVYTETGSNIGFVTTGPGTSGHIYTGLPAPGTTQSAAIAAQALIDATTAYNTLVAMPPGTVEADLSGLTLGPGTYTSASTMQIIGTDSSKDLTLDGQGNPSALFVFQIGSAPTVGSAGPTGARSVNLINGALSKNVFWQVGSAATINGAGGGTFSGTVISQAAISTGTAGTSTLTTINGRLLALGASTTIVSTLINVPTP